MQVLGPLLPMQQIQMEFKGSGLQPGCCKHWELSQPMAVFAFSLSLFQVDKRRNKQTVLKIQFFNIPFLQILI